MITLIYLLKVKNNFRSKPLKIIEEDSQTTFISKSNSVQDLETQSYFNEDFEDNLKMPEHMWERVI